MFAHGASPSDAEYDRFLDKVRNTPGYEFYTSKTHSNYRSRLRPRREAAAARRVSQSVQTTRDDAGAGADAAGWGTADAHTTQQWDGVGHHVPPSTPSSDASSSTRSDCAPLLEDATSAELAYGTLAMRAPAVFAQIRAARDPTVTQFEQWAEESGLPAVELFSMFLVLREGHVGVFPGVSGFAHRTCQRVLTVRPPARFVGLRCHP